MNIMNSVPFFFLCLIPVAVVAIFSVDTLRRAWKEGKAIGMDTALMKKISINSIIVCIIPTLAIIVSLAALAPTLGAYLPWFRLSVIGSAPYEMLAANIALKQTGVAEGLGAAMIPDSSFISIIWAMTFGCLSSLIVTTIFLKRLDNGLAKAAGKTTIIGAAASVSMLAVINCFAVTKLFDVANPLGIVGVIAGAALSYIFIQVRKHGGPKWLKDFAFPISMVGAMVIVTIVSRIIA